MYLLGLKYLEALPLLTQGKGTTIFLPAEASGVMGALGGLRELLNSTSEARHADTAGTRDPGSRSQASSGLGYPGVPKALPGSTSSTG